MPSFPSVVCVVLVGSLWYHYFPSPSVASVVKLQHSFLKQIAFLLALQLTFWRMKWNIQGINADYKKLLILYTISGTWSTMLFNHKFIIILWEIETNSSWGYPTMISDIIIIIILLMMLVSNENNAVQWYFVQILEQNSLLETRLNSLSFFLSTQ